MTPRLYAATVTPLTPAGACDIAALQDHIGWLLAGGCDGVALFGTTGEGPSFTVEERETALDGLLDAGVDPRRIIVGIGCAALPDAVRLARHAAARNCLALLALPPFFFKDPDDDGLFDAFAAIIEATEDTKAPVIPYNIPPVSGITLGIDLIQRLQSRFGARIAGVKDSSGDWPYTADLLRSCPDLPVYVGNEPDFSAALAAGAAGTISGLANLVPGPLHALLNDPTSSRQAAIDQLAAIFDEGSFVPMLKAALAMGEAPLASAAVRAPLRSLDDHARDTLQRALQSDTLADLLSNAAKVPPR